MSVIKKIKVCIILVLALIAASCGEMVPENKDQPRSVKTPPPSAPK